MHLHPQIQISNAFPDVILLPTLALKIPKLHLIYKYINRHSNLNKVFNKFSFVILQKRTCCGKHGTLEIRTYSIEPIIMQRHLVINWNVSTVIKFQYAHFFLFVEKTYYYLKSGLTMLFFLLYSTFVHSPIHNFEPFLLLSFFRNAVNLLVKPKKFGEMAT